nr:hypothetical protein HmN_000963200 [Hymenolepis microstoma]
MDVCLALLNVRRLFSRRLLFAVASSNLHSDRSLFARAALRLLRDFRRRCRPCPQPGHPSPSSSLLGARETSGSPLGLRSPEPESSSLATWRLWTQGNRLVITARCSVEAEERSRSTGSPISRKRLRDEEEFIKVLRLLFASIGKEERTETKATTVVNRSLLSLGNLVVVGYPLPLCPPSPPHLPYVPQLPHLLITYPEYFSWDDDVKVGEGENREKERTRGEGVNRKYTGVYCKFGIGSSVYFLILIHKLVTGSDVAGIGVLSCSPLNLMVGGERSEEPLVEDLVNRLLCDV